MNRVIPGCSLGDEFRFLKLEFHGFTISCIRERPGNNKKVSYRPNDLGQERSRSCKPLGSRSIDLRHRSLTTPKKVENGVFTLKRSVDGKHSIQYQMFSVHTTSKKFQNATITHRSLERMHDYTDVTVFEKFQRFQKVFLLG